MRAYQHSYQKQKKKVIGTSLVTKFLLAEERGCLVNLFNEKGG